MTAPLFPHDMRHGRPPFFLSRSARGTLAGLLAAAIWATFMVATQSGTRSGLLPQDFLLLRFSTAALIMLPWLLRNNPACLAGIGWRRGSILTFLAGPLFILLGTGGYLYAPLAHGAVIQPSAIALATMIVAAVLLKERITRTKLAGMVLIMTGLLVIAGQAGVMGEGMVWIGDLLFVAAGLWWTAFAILIKRWKLDAIAVTATVSALAALVVVPGFLVVSDTARLAALPLAALAMQVFVQGALAGVVAVIAFGRAVRHLGAAKAGLFPALVPAATLTLSALATGAMPNVYEWGGAALATFGLLIAVGVARAPFAANDFLMTKQGLLT